NNTDVETTTVNPATTADLGVFPSHDPEPVSVGGDLTYTAEVFNFGLGVAPNTVLTQTLPAGMNLVSVETTVGTCTASGGVITCDLGALNPFDFVDITVHVTPTVLGSFDSDFQVSSSVEDPDPSDDTATEPVTVVPPGADLSVSASHTPEPGAVG